jgi:hypothetical protein
MFYSDFDQIFSLLGFVCSIVLLLIAFKPLLFGAKFMQYLRYYVIGCTFLNCKISKYLFNEELELQKIQKRNDLKTRKRTPLKSL